MLVLNQPGIPGCSQSPSVNKHEIAGWDDLVKERRDHIGELTLFFIFRIKVDFASGDHLQEGRHLWNPLLLINCLYFWVSLYFLVMEFVWHQLASYHQLLLRQVFAGPKIGKDLFADRHRPFNNLIVKERFVEAEIEDVKIKSATIGSDKGNVYILGGLLL